MIKPLSTALSTLLCCLIGQVQAAVILQYHHVDTQTPAATSIDPELFAQHMAYLDEADFEVWPLDKIMRALDEGTPLPNRVVAITFDDGYASVRDQALPVLRRYNFPFTVFVNPVLVGTSSDFLSWDELEHLESHGATIANHTQDHPHLIRRAEGESAEVWRERVRRQIADAETAIREHMGDSPGMLAYPYGEYDEEVKAIVGNLELIAFAQHSGAFDAGVDRLAVPRFPFGGPYGDLADFKTKANTLPLPLDSVRLYAPARPGTALQDPLLPEGVDRPVLELELKSPSLASAVTCFASGQGAIDVDVDGSRIRTRPERPLPTGRSRINCTAPSGEPGRFYWYSHFMIRKLPDGSWYQES